MGIVENIAPDFNNRFFGLGVENILSVCPNACNFIYLLSKIKFYEFESVQKAELNQFDASMISYCHVVLSYE